MAEPARSEQLATVHRALTAVELVAANGSLTLTQLASMMDVGMTTAHRLAGTLLARDWLAKNADLTYRLGSGLTGILATSTQSTDIRASVRPLLERLGAETEETIHLTKLDGRTVVYLDQVVSTKPVHSVAKIGGRSPAHCVSPGISQLSRQSDEFLDWFFREELVRYTPNTIADAGRFRALLGRVRERGYAINLGGFRPDVGGVGVALVNQEGLPIAALSVCAPVYRLKSSDKDAIGALLLDTAAAAQEILRAGNVAAVA